MSINLKTLAVIGLVACAGSAFAGFGTPTIDGTLDGGYGAAYTLQTSQTSFGDDTVVSNPVDNSNELDALYLMNDGTQLYVFMAGNMGQDNGIFFLFDDVAAASGNSALPAILPSKDGCWGGAEAGQNGSIGTSLMPNGFDPEYGLWFKIFDFPTDASVDSVYSWADFEAVVATETPSDLNALGSTHPVIFTNSGAGFSQTFGFNNSNIAGVEAGAGPATGDPSTVTTGIEFNVPLSEIGVAAGDDVQVFVLLGGGSFGGSTFMSNQYLPPLAVPEANLGNPATTPPAFDFSSTGKNVTMPTPYNIAATAAAENWEMYD